MQIWNVEVPYTQFFQFKYCSTTQLWFVESKDTEETNLCDLGRIFDCMEGWCF